MKVILYISLFICLISIKVHAAEINSYSSFVSTISGNNNTEKSMLLDGYLIPIILNVSK